MLKHLLVIAVLLLTGAGSPAAQACLHGRTETGADRMRRERAMQLAHRINAEQRGRLVPAPRLRYRTLDQLGDLPPTPQGFDLNLLTDGASYAFSVKDRLDPCNYAIFSDQDGKIYAAEADNQFVILPVEAR